MTRLRKHALFSCLLLVLCVPALSWAFDAPPAGTYHISGNDPGSETAEKYSGTLQLTNSGDIFTFEGVVDGQNFHGTGIYIPQSRTLSVGFTGERPEERGITVLQWDGTILKGRWMYLDNPQAVLGSEEWSPVQ